MKISFLICITSIFLFSSCDKEVNIEVPEHKPILGVTALWGPDSALQATVVRSLSMAETPSFNMYNSSYDYKKMEKYAVSTASVLVLKDGVVYDNLVFDTQNYCYKTNSNKKASPGATYTIQVSAAGFTNVSTPMLPFPDRVSIKSIERNTVGVSEFGNKQDEIILTFDDPETVKNYYWISIGKNIVFPNLLSYAADFYSSDPDVVRPVSFDLSATLPGLPLLMLKDDGFDGQTKRLVFRVSSWGLYGGPDGNTRLPITISLNAISEDLFKYLRSRILNVSNPFSSPIQPHSNITNGLGIFGLYTSNQKVVQ